MNGIYQRRMDVKRPWVLTVATSPIANLGAELPTFGEHPPTEIMSPGQY